MSPSFATPQDAEAAFYEAFERCDLDAMMAIWAEDEEVVCVHPGGPRLTGMERVRESWRQVFGGSPGLRFRLASQQQVKGMMLSVHSVEEHIRVPGESGNHLVVATNVYMLTPRGWRILVHHASPAPPPPEQADFAPPAGHLH